MRTTIVEKVIIQNGQKRELFAVATSEQVPQSVLWSLTFESYLTKWTSRADAENLQGDIDGLPAFRVIREDGSDYVTSMARGVTLEQAQAYFIGKRFTDEDDNGKETPWTVAGVSSAVNA